MASTQGESKKEASDKPMTAGQRLAAQKAAKAARKAAERGKGAEQREDDVVKRAAAAGDWVRRNRRLLWTTALGVVLLVGGITGYTIYRSQQAEAASGLLWEATRTATAAVLGEDEPAPADSDESYPSYDARGTEAAEGYRRVLSKHPRARAALWARLGEGNALLQAGKAKEAQKSFAAITEQASDDDTVEWRAREGLGFAYEAQERWDDAASQYEALAAIADGRYRNLADYHLARMQAARGESDEAQQTLRSLLDRLQQKEDDEPELPYTRRRAEARLAALDPSYSPTPTGMGPAPGGAGAGPGGTQMSQEKIRELLQKLQKQQGAGAGPGDGPEGAIPLEAPSGGEAPAPLTLPSQGGGEGEGAPAGEAPGGAPGGEAPQGAAPAGEAPGGGEAPQGGATE